MNITMFIANAGLGKLQDTLVSNWIGPAFFIIVAAFAVKFIISRQFRELAGFLAIAAVVALLVFNADGLFGSGGIFYNIAKAFSEALGNGGGNTGGPSGAGGMINILKNLKF